MDTNAYVSPLCPGQRSQRKHPDRHPYLRFVFEAQWQDGAPGAQVFYVRDYELDFSPAGFAPLQADAEARMRRIAINRGPALLRMTYLNYGMWEMSDAEAAALGDYVIVGTRRAPAPPDAQPAPDTPPAPVATDPAPVPAAPADPVPAPAAEPVAPEDNPAPEAAPATPVAAPAPYALPGTVPAAPVPAPDAVVREGPTTESGVPMTGMPS